MYSLEVRNIALRAYHSIGSLRKVASIIGTSHSTVYRWLQNPQPMPIQRIRSCLKSSPAVVDCLKLKIATNPFVTCNELAKMVYETFGFTCSRQLISSVLKTKLGYSRKNARYVGKANVMKIQEFVAKRDAFTQQNRPFVILDETGFQKNIGCKKGYSLRGTRLEIENKNLRIGKNISVLAAISKDSLLCFEKREDSFNTASFLNFLETHQEKIPRNCVIILDNVSFHHSKIIRDFAISKGWELLFTPPYCPRFSPIEGVFSVVKNHYRKHQNIDEEFAIPLHVDKFYNYSWSLKT